MKTLMSLIFYPRGGSAQVARYLSRALLESGHDVHLVTGTLRDGDPQHDAEVFFGDLPLTLVDYTLGCAFSLTLRSGGVHPLDVGGDGHVVIQP